MASRRQGSAAASLVLGALSLIANQMAAAFILSPPPGFHITSSGRPLPRIFVGTRPGALRIAVHVRALESSNNSQDLNGKDESELAGIRISLAKIGLYSFAAWLSFQALVALSISISRGALLAVGAALAANVGKVCQKRGTQSLPLLQLDPSVLRSYFGNPWWLVGFLADLGGAILTVVALSMAPVSVVEPILGSGPGIVAVSSFFLTSDKLRSSDWAAAALCVVGTVGLGLTAVDSRGAVEAVNKSMAALLLLLFGTAVGASEMMQLRGVLSKKIAACVSSGVCFGLSVCSTRCGMTLAPAFGSAAVALGIAGSVVLTSGGFVAMTRGFREGSALSICVYANLFSLLVGQLFGLLALAEPLPASAPDLALRAASLALLVGGSLLLQAGPPSLQLQSPQAQPP